MHELENQIKSSHGFLQSVNPTDSLVQWLKRTEVWMTTNSAGLIGDLLTWLLIVPFVTFVLLNEGPALRKRLFQLVPNRYFESAFIVTNEIGNSLAEYLRAKLFEAVLVGLLTTVGLALIHAPYPVILGVIAGVTNIIPYVGPFFGAAPAILITLMEPSLSSLIIPVLIVYSIVNIVDMVVIFPFIVAKLVDLHPLVLIAVVVVGQRYYGLVGMLISIPMATALKVVIEQIHTAVYDQRARRTASSEWQPETLVFRD